MQVYHQTCPWWRRLLRYRTLGDAPVSRFRLIAQSRVLSTLTYRCEACRTVLHVDTDWAEDESAALDVDADAGFIPR